MKGEKKPLVIIPFFISLSLYGGIVFGIFYYLGYHEELIKKYSSKKDNFLEVAIIQKEKSVVKPTKATVKDEKKIKKPPKKEAPKEVMKPKTSPKEIVALKNLFGKIKTKDINLSKPIPVSNKAPTKASRLKPKKTKKVKASKKAKSLAKSLNLQSAPTLSASASSGEYDKFRGQIQEMLDGFWSQTIETQSGAEANVKVLIDEDGHFSYDIVNFSYNNDFNTKLREFLEDMQSVKFPKNENNVPALNIKFKDSME